MTATAATYRDYHGETYSAGDSFASHGRRCTISVDDKGRIVAIVTERCGKCGGAGGSEAWRFTGWTCFNCGGDGVHPTTRRVRVYTDAEYPKVEARRDKAQARKAAKAQAKADAEAARIEREGARYIGANLVAHKAAMVVVLAYTGDDAFIMDIRDKAREMLLTARQVEAAGEAIAREIDRNTVPERDLVTGRRVIEGTVLVTKYQDSQFGSTLKMLVREADGNKVWGSVPAAIYMTDKGDTVRFTATVERSAEDAHFGYYSRPAKAEIIEEAAA